MSNLFKLGFNTVFVNSLDAFTPQYWAMESIAILEENLVMGALVHRDFEEIIASSGNIVNTRKPATFTAKRKGVNDNVTTQNATATNVAVPLDQTIHVSFVIKDAEMSYSFKDLVAEYLYPAMFAEVKMLDQIVLGQMGRFYPNVVGYLGGMTSSNAHDTVVDASTKLNVLKAPMQQRRMIWTPNTQGLALKNELFVSAEKAGDGGLARRQAELGIVQNFANYGTQLAGEVTAANSNYVSGAINLAAGYDIGVTALTVDGFSAAIANGTWVSVNGDLHRVVSTTGGATPTVITIDSPGLRRAVADNAVVRVCTAAAINEASGYAAGYSGILTFDGATKPPIAGQLVAFGTSTTSAVYTIIECDSTTMVLDRPLEAALADDATVHFALPGYYNFAFHRNAIALVSRPLATPPAGAGVSSQVINFNNASVRVTITYDGLSQGLRITLDMLLGVQVLDQNLATLVLA